MSESEGLAREAAAGNAAAFGVLVRLNQSKLRGFLLRMTKGNHALADDLAQETFLEAFRKIGQYGNGSFFGWLCAIAYSRYLMEARKRKLEPHRQANHKTQRQHLVLVRQYAALV